MSMRAYKSPFFLAATILVISNSLSSLASQLSVPVLITGYRFFLFLSPRCTWFSFISSILSLLSDTILTHTFHISASVGKYCFHCPVLFTIDSFQSFHKAQAKSVIQVIIPKFKLQPGSLYCQCQQQNAIVIIQGFVTWMTKKHKESLAGRVVGRKTEV